MRNITEYPITPDTPKVTFKQQLNVHVPIASTFNKGIAQYDDAYFSVINGVVKLNDKVIEDFINIVDVDLLPDLSEANPNLLYHVMTDYDTIWICDNDKTRWIQIDKAVVIVATAEDIKDSTKIYILSENSGDIKKGVYVLNDNTTLRLLSANDLGVNGRVSLLPTGWAGSTYTLTMYGLGVNDAVFFNPVTKIDKNLLEYANIFVSSEGNIVIFSAEKTPSSKIDLNYFIARGGS